MGGRHASRIVSYYRDKHGRFTRYGEEYKCELQVGKIKFVTRRSRNGYKDPPAAPLETRTHGRIYVTIGRNGQPKAVTFYDKHGRRSRKSFRALLRRGFNNWKFPAFEHLPDILGWDP